MPEQKPFVSLYDSCHDVGVFGAGYAGYAAAVRLAKEGKRVFLADPRGDLLWESGRAFYPVPGSMSPGFDFLTDVIARVSGIAGEWVDGGTAEFTANELLRDAALPRLYYVSPVGVEREGDRIAAVIVATKSGPRRLVARQWIDATETGTLARLAGLPKAPRAPDRLVARLLFQKRQWPSADRILRSRACPDCRITWEASGWSAERALQIDMPGSETRFLRFFVPALEALRASAGDELNESFVSHASYVPYPLYARGSGKLAPAANLALAVPGYAPGPIATLGDRYRLGHDAAGRLAALPASGKTRRPSRSVRLPEPVKSLPAAGIAVAGLGTGGPFAALAAARAGARVTAFDPLLFAGGIGVGGGIPEYYWGMAGGLQAEVDDRVRRLMPLFGGRDCWPRGFHPDAKRVVLDELLHEAGVEVLFGTMLAGVEKQGGRVTAALVASPGGLLRLTANAWIDSTGDGDLCAFAGAKTSFGRTGDGVPQAYTQSCGHFLLQNGKVVVHIVNPDTGIVDNADSEDATRARIEGLHALFQPINAFDRLTYAVPMLGIRQGRLVKTDYQLTLDDLVDRRRFPDAVGYSVAHYDNHASDYEFESDDTFFYVNCAGLWSMRTACEIPYRMLLPKGLSNVWIACRAAGAAEEAFPSMRMQRDYQRIGEVCGLAATLAGRRAESRAVPYPALRARLEASGALSLSEPVGIDFGRSGRPSDFSALPETQPGLSLWKEYRSDRRAATPGLRKLVKSKDRAAAWRSAMVLGAWGDVEAEPRLLTAVKTREVGAEAAAGAVDPQRGSRAILPRWWIALTLLRRCGTSAAIPVLIRLAQRNALPFRLKTSLALTLAALAGKGTKQALRKTVAAALAGLEASIPVDAVDGWSLAYAVARARSAWGFSQSASVCDYRLDSRAHVRRAFQELA